MTRNTAAAVSMCLGIAQAKFEVRQIRVQLSASVEALQVLARQKALPLAPKSKSYKIRSTMRAISSLHWQCKCCIEPVQLLSLETKLCCLLRLCLCQRSACARSKDLLLLVQTAAVGRVCVAYRLRQQACSQAGALLAVCCYQVTARLPTNAAWALRG